VSAWRGGAAARLPVDTADKSTCSRGKQGLQAEVYYKCCGSGLNNEQQNKEVKNFMFCTVAVLDVLF
jgi:hypothetical protein